MYPKPVSFASFFSDMPWLNIPRGRETTFIKPPMIRGGLLGGASTTGKMSKLQALAAARKKKADEQKLEDKQIPGTIRQFGNLSTTSRDPRLDKENVRSPIEAPQETERFTRTSATDVPNQSEPGCPNLKYSQSQNQITEIKKDKPKNLPTPPSPLLGALSSEIAMPSSFAQALLDPLSSSTKPVSRHYPFPYMSMNTSVADAFSAPSPDDVILKAQSQGSLLERMVVK